ncbi:MAG TPA: hypothetical protein DD379_26990, partial [Cyanobacteria bacterium UBA11162]|nr:hypothetical protein [Cyanobacteria bacterium UBA11162]
EILTPFKTEGLVAISEEKVESFDFDKINLYRTEAFRFSFDSLFNVNFSPLLERGLICIVLLNSELQGR